jgi:hypothetical protein
MALILPKLIRSTEYSGPKGVKMVAQNAIVVTGCGHDDATMMMLVQQR